MIPYSTHIHSSFHTPIPPSTFTHHSIHPSFHAHSLIIPYSHPSTHIHSSFHTPITPRTFTHHSIHPSLHAHSLIIPYTHHSMHIHSSFHTPITLCLPVSSSDCSIRLHCRLLSGLTLKYFLCREQYSELAAYCVTKPVCVCVCMCVCVCTHAQLQVKTAHLTISSTHPWRGMRRVWRKREISR